VQLFSLLVFALVQLNTACREIFIEFALTSVFSELRKASNFLNLRKRFLFYCSKHFRQDSDRMSLHQLVLLMMPTQSNLVFFHMYLFISADSCSFTFKIRFQVPPRDSSTSFSWRNDRIPHELSKHPILCHRTAIRY